MSNITTDTLFSLRKATKGGNVQRVPANSATCLENSVIGFRPSTGYAVRWSATAGDLFMGFATKAVTSGTEFEVSDELCGKIICGTTNEDGLLVAGLTAQTLCPALVYLNSTDNISADLTITPTGPAIGLALKCVSSGYGWVMFFHPATTNQTIHDVRTVSAKTTVVTLTIAELLTGIITGTHAAGADQAYTLPLGTDCEAARTWATNETFEWSLVNLSGTPATNTITITANTGHTIVGPGVAVGSATAALNTRRCLTRRSAANTFITYVF